MAEFDAICPHCNASVVVEEDWIGLDVECPECGRSFTVEEMATFTFVCPECGSSAELPMSKQGQKYECKSCCEESIAEPAMEKRCPYCGEIIKFHAKVCKFCKKRLGASVAVEDAERNQQIAMQGMADSLNSCAPSAPTAFQPSGQYSKQNKINPKLLWITGGAIAFGIGLSIIIFSLFYFLDSAKKIPLSPKLEKKYSFSWKSASIDKIRKWNKKVISEKKKDEKLYINAVGEDGVTRSFQFDSAERLTNIICKLDIEDSIDMMVKLNEKYKKNEAPVLSDDKEFMTMKWIDKDSNTTITIVTKTDNLDTFLMLSPEQ